MKISISLNQPTDDLTAFAIVFLGVLVTVAIATIGVAVSSVVGVFLSGVLCVILTIMAVVAMMVIYTS